MAFMGNLAKGLITMTTFSQFILLIFIFSLFFFFSKTKNKIYVIVTLTYLLPFVNFNLDHNFISWCIVNILQQPLGQDLQVHLTNLDLHS
jgi:hypothetical protein